ncbi:MAG: class I SAM-dependent methyltransferase [Cyclobacteriaceae bacterium]
MVRNVFACLVHDNPDCILDLVRNLNYYDPGSVVLLYNGGQDRALLKGISSNQDLNLIIHPDARPQKYGYLHGFALDCMRYANRHLAFDTLTIVDSDQLLIRKGYSEFLDATISGVLGKAGLFSYDERPVGRDNKENYVAGQAFREYELWESFISKFSNGQEAFVHWTFWPTTIFSRQATIDLLALYDEDKQLRNIVSKSSVWAIEEVLFPTLCKLLNYEIHANPCKQELVRFRKEFNTEELNRGLGDVRNFWVHPVERNFNNPIRKRIREMSYNYNSNVSSNCVPDDNAVQFNFSFDDVLARIDKIEGWLSRKEADLLMSATMKACIDLRGVHAMVEIGSYHGKSTVLIGNILKTFNPRATLYAIDPHNGMVGDEQQKLLQLTPSLAAFMRNIKREKLGDHVELIQDFSFTINWKKKISLLFIDGLHDYNNVSRDFNQFAAYIKTGGFVVFHDYADYYPGVKTFVDELQAGGKFIRVALAESLMVLQKQG